MDFASALEQCLLRRMDLMAFDSYLEKNNLDLWQKQSPYLKYIGFGKILLLFINFKRPRTGLNRKQKHANENKTSL